MTDKVENLILEQLRLMREDMQTMRSEMTGGFSEVTSRIDDLEAGQQAIQGVLFGLGRSMYLLESRVEHIEEKLGIDT